MQLSQKTLNIIRETLNEEYGKEHIDMLKDKDLNQFGVFLGTMADIYSKIRARQRKMEDLG